MSTSENKRYQVFNGEPQKLTLSRMAVVTCLRQTAGRINAMVATRPLDNDLLRISVTWGSFIGTVVADGTEELSDTAFRQLEMYWARADGQPLQEGDNKTITSFMQIRTTVVHRRGKRSKLNKISGFIELFHIVSTGYLNR